MDIKAWIKKYEGLELHTYIDKTGHITIGWGRNLGNGISIDEAELMFDNDFAQCIKDLNRRDWYISQPENVRMALINMCFNLGIAELQQFSDMIAALERKDYQAAATAALNSKWAAQVGQRAKDVAVMIREGDVSQS